MNKELVTIVPLLLVICVSLTACGEENVWQLVDLSEEPELSDEVHRRLPGVVGSPMSPHEVEELQVRMVDWEHPIRQLNNVSTYQTLVTYRERGRDLVFMGRLSFTSRGEGVGGGSGSGRWHVRDYDQPVEYMVHQMINTVTARNTRFHYVAVWTNSPEVEQIHIRANNQSFDVEGDMSVLRWESSAHLGIEHLELIAMDEEGEVIWQDEW